MNMAQIAKGSVSKARSPNRPSSCARRSGAPASDRGGKPYLIDAQVARVGVAWADKPWIPPISIARERTRKV